MYSEVVFCLLPYAIYSITKILHYPLSIALLAESNYDTTCYEHLVKEQNWWNGRITSSTLWPS